MITWTTKDILDDIHEGKLRLALQQEEADTAAQRRHDEWMADMEAAWAPIIATIKESIPQWAWEHLTHPGQMPTFVSEHVTMIRPATIDLERLGMVFAYAVNTAPPRFRPAIWALEDDEETWGVYPFGGGSEETYSISFLTPDFLIALAQAYDNAQRIPEAKAEAELRNAERQKSKVEQPPAKAEFDWLDDDGITVPNSVYINGQWATAHWLADVVDEETGELIITATLAGEPGQGPVVTALRMDMELARELRAMALDGAAADADCRTTRERLDASERRVRELALVTTNHEQRIELLVSTLTNTNGRLAWVENKLYGRTWPGPEAGL